MKFLCPHCSQRLNVDDSQAGRRGKCPKCGSKVEIPHANVVKSNQAAKEVSSAVSTAEVNHAVANQHSFADAEVHRDDTVVAAAEETLSRSIDPLQMPPGDRSKHDSQHANDGNVPTEPASTVTKNVLDVPREFGRYRISRMLGQGGMGTVYLAEDTQLERPVALKIPREDAAIGADARLRFEREAKTAAKLSHPGICQVYDVGEWAGRQFLAMEFVSGRPLSHFARRRELSDLQAVRIVHRIAVAMEAAHRQKVIHRDLKPSNILVTETGEPKVMDFGLALRLDATDTRLTQSGAIVGTPSYMAKEQLMAEKDQIGPASDVYSLGVILYELLTGKLPHEVPPKAPLAALLAKLLCVPPDPITKHRPELDPRLQAIIAKSLAESLTERFRSMGELATQLDEFLKATATDESSIIRRPIFDNLASPNPMSGDPVPHGVDDLPPQAATIIEPFWKTSWRQTVEKWAKIVDRLRHSWPEWQRAFRSGGNTTLERFQTLAVRLRDELRVGHQFYRAHRETFWRRIWSGPYRIWHGTESLANEQELFIHDRERIEAVWDVDLPERCVVCGIETDRQEQEQVRRLENFETTSRLLWLILSCGLILAVWKPFWPSNVWWHGWWWIPAVMIPAIPITFRLRSQEFASVRFRCCSEHAANTRYPELVLVSGGLLVGIGSGRAKRRIGEELQNRESQRQSQGIDVSGFRNDIATPTPEPLDDTSYGSSSRSQPPPSIRLVDEVEPTPILHAIDSLSKTPEAGELPILASRNDISEEQSPTPPPLLLIAEADEKSLLNANLAEEEILDGILIDDDDEEV